MCTAQVTWSPRSLNYPLCLSVSKPDIQMSLWTWKMQRRESSKSLLCFWWKEGMAGEYLHLSRRSLLQWIWGMTSTLAVWGLALGRTEQWTVAWSVQVYNRRVWKMGTGEAALQWTSVAADKLFDVSTGAVLSGFTRHKVNVLDYGK